MKGTLFHKQTKKAQISKKDEKTLKESFNPPKIFKESATGKYGSGEKRQEIFNEGCMKGVREVIETIEDLKSSNADLGKTKIALKGLMRKLGKIRNDIAIDTQSYKEDIPFFGRSRLEDPYKIEGATVIDKTAINNDQHKDSHTMVKKLLKTYLSGVITRKELTGTVKDDPNNPNSRYVITAYRKSFEFVHLQSKEEIILDDIPENKLRIFFLFNSRDYSVTYSFPLCENDAAKLSLSDAMEKAPNVKYLIIAETQINVGNEKWVTGTTHTTWCTDDLSVFDKESEVVVLHTPQGSHEALFGKIAELWLKAIQWNEKESELKQLNEIMADIQFYMGQAMFFYRGSPTVSKMFQKGTYFSQGFLHPATKTETDEHCTAENNPFLKLYRSKYLQCLACDPTTNRSENKNSSQEQEIELNIIEGKKTPGFTNQ